MNHLLITLVGPDATGIVARLAALVEAHGGNWLDSRMIRMGGTFSGLLRVELPAAGQAAFAAELAQFMDKAGLRHTLAPAAPEPAAVAAGASASLELSGQDHPGIVHAVFAACQRLGVNVDELSTGLTIAPWSGTPIFEAKARLGVPESVLLAELRASLEALAADLLVEIHFSH